LSVEALIWKSKFSKIGNPAYKNTIIKPIFMKICSKRLQKSIQMSVFSHSLATLTGVSITP
jgi:hypothetical protein